MNTEVVKQSSKLENTKAEIAELKRMINRRQLEIDSVQAQVSEGLIEFLICCLILNCILISNPKGCICLQNAQQLIFFAYILYVLQISKESGAKIIISLPGSIKKSNRFSCCSSKKKGN